MLTKRDFLGEETYKAWKTDEEQLLQFRNQVSDKAKQGGKPSAEDLAILAVNKPWISFYKVVLSDPRKEN
jgi:hypothetical protein